MNRKPKKGKKFLRLKTKPLSNQKLYNRILPQLKKKQLRVSEKQLRIKSNNNTEGMRLKQPLLKLGEINSLKKQF